MGEKRTSMCDEKRDSRQCGVLSERAKRMGMSMAIIGMLVWPTNAFALTFVGHVLPILSVVTYQGPGAPVESVAWSLDEKHLASASEDGTAQVWNTP